MLRRGFPANRSRSSRASRSSSTSSSNARRRNRLREVIVATDDTRIWEVAQNFCRVEMTRPEHPSGTRPHRGSRGTNCRATPIVNIQGDEPLIDPAVIDAVANALAQNEMSTAATRIKNPAELDNPNVVKVVVNAAGRALYFSRRTIPYLREAASGSTANSWRRFLF